jgi:minimal PKS chain-length factor (CLF/KS beta)
MVASAVVTGLGVTAPTGLGTEEYWSATLNGKSAIGRLTRFDPQGYPGCLAAEILDFEPRDHLSGRLIPATDRTTQLALVATAWALSDAAIKPEDVPEYRMGVVTAADAGGFDFGHRELERMWSQGPEYVSAYQSIAWFYAVHTGQISIRHGMRGPSGVLVSDQAGGLDALAHARRQVAGKGIELMVCGGVGGALGSWGWVAQWSGGGLSESGDPDAAYLPFDARASGYVPGEGGAILLVENAEAAHRRGAPKTYGEIAGYAATFDRPAAGGHESGLRRAIELAMIDAGVGRTDIDVVFADAAGIPDLDEAEARAIAAVFGPGGVPVAAPKTMTGRLYSGGAALDLVTALLSIRDGLIPPAVNVTAVPRYELDLVTGAPREVPVRAALVLARGKHGFNSAVVLRRHSSANPATTARGDTRDE